MKEYDTNQIIYTNNPHLFEALVHSKILLIKTNEAIIMALNIPILKPTSFTYFQIYSILNLQNKFILLSAKHFLQSNHSERCFSDCKNLHNQSLCQTARKNEKCSLENLSSYQAAKTTNDYRIIQQMENTALMVSTKKPTGNHINLIIPSTKTDSAVQRICIFVVQRNPGKHHIQKTRGRPNCNNT